MKVEKDEFLIDGGKSAMMTMRRRPLADRSRLELQQRLGWSLERNIWGFGTRRLQRIILLKVVASHLSYMGHVKLISRHIADDLYE